MENRRLERIFLPRSILVQSRTLGLSDSAAVLQDISALGAYFYTLLPLAKNDPVELFLAVGDQYLSFRGAVVRVEKGITANSLAVAVAFSGFRELEDSCRA